jgi:hypothetical protein
MMNELNGSGLKEEFGYLIKGRGRGGGTVLLFQKTKSFQKLDFASQFMCCLYIAPYYM